MDPPAASSVAQSGNDRRSPSSASSLPGRDPLADADDSLIRKRLRLSQEQETPPSGDNDNLTLSASRSPLVVEVHEEQSLDQSGFAIIMAGDEMNRFKDVTSFPWVNAENDTPEAAAKSVADAFCNKKGQVSENVVSCLLEWLGNHLDATDDEFVAILDDASSLFSREFCRVYSDSVTFWNHLVESLDGLAGRGKLSIEASPDIFEQFLSVFIRLGERLLHTDATSLAQTNARRDSTQLDDSATQSLLFASWPMLFIKLIDRRDAIDKSLPTRHSDVISIWTRAILRCQNCIMDAIVKMLKHIVNRPETIQSPFYAAYLYLTSCCEALLCVTEMNSDQLQDLYKKSMEVFETTRTMVVHLLPKIRLDDTSQRVSDCFGVALCSIFETLIKKGYILPSSAFDMVLKEVAEHQLDPTDLIGSPTISTPQAETITYNSDIEELLTQNIQLACAYGCQLEYLNALIRCSSMELRIRSLDKLRTLTLEVWDKSLPELKEYAVRFLHANYVVPYLCGPQSHAAMISKSSGAVGFLCAMQGLARTDADALWNALTNTQRPDTAHGTYELLSSLVQNMHASERMYFCNKYVSLPSSQLNKGLTNLFFQFMSCPEQMSGSLPDPFEAASICIRLMDKSSDSDMTIPAQDDLARIIGHTLSVLPSPRDVAEQLQLVEYCASLIRGHTMSVTGCVYALLCILCRQNRPLVPRTEIVTRVSFKDCVKDLILFIKQVKDNRQGLSEISLSCRIELSLYILSLSPPDATVELEEDFWAYSVGEDAYSAHARNQAWSNLIHGFQILSGAYVDGFYERCISQYLPTLSPECVVTHTYRLFELQDSRQTDDPQALLPLEKHFLRFAISCPCDQDPDQYVQGLIEHLFKGKALQNPTLAIEKQLETVRYCIEQLSVRDLPTYSPSLRAAHLLRDLLTHSTLFEQSTSYQSKELPDLVVRSGSETMRIPIRIHKGEAQPQSRAVTVDKDAKCSELEAAISSETGFANYTAISAGQKLDLAAEPGQSIVQLGINHGSTLIVQKYNTLQSIQDEIQNEKGATAVSRELLRYLDTLYDALHKSRTATTEQIFQLLAQLKFPGHVRALVASSDTPLDDLLPPEKPFIVRLTIEVLFFQLHEQIRVGIADERFLSRGVHLLVELLGRPHCLTDSFVVYRAAEVLLQLLRERPINDVPETYFKDPADFVKQSFARLSNLLAIDNDRVGSSKDAYQGWAIRCIYACILESVLLSPAVGVAFALSRDVVNVHLNLFLTGDLHLMERMPSLLRTALSNRNMHTNFKSCVCSLFINHLIPAAQDQPTRCVTVYSVAADVLLSDQNLMQNEDSLRALLAKFSSTLLNMEHLENYRNSFADYRIQGLTELIRVCIRGLKSLKKPLNATHLASKLFTKFLFPVAAAGQDGTSSTPAVNADARKKIFDLIRLLCGNSQTVEELSDLCDEACASVSFPTDFTYNGSENLMRSEFAYSGLVNLSQTCYMNSLLQQLFMNIRLRKFIFDTAIIDPEKQVILHEFKIAFARMQDSLGVSHNPEALAKALDVEVTLQDDAHIFFTTLVGKLEDSMPNEESRKVLRSFFGGSNKSQILASCKHVSESSDEYFNLSLVVKDKATLIESLEEYVHGAALEGGDKFKCTTCGSGEGTYVDAMRRTALDKIPDNLVLGLKRFRYETFDGGAKVNDRFTFPARIDMSPYKLHRLAGVDGYNDPDIFQLVGVVVHQGTLQFGHYWSYAAERGRPGPGPLPWYRFEDDKVVRSNIEEVMQETCGGPMLSSTSVQREQSPALRSDNAYVLFYERVSSVRESTNIVASDQSSVAPSVHTRVELPDDLAIDIKRDNEQTVKILNLFAMDHMEFVRGLVSKLDNASEEDTTKRLALESKVLHMLYRYFVNIMPRSCATDAIECIAQALRKLACTNANHAIWLLESLLSVRASESLVLHRRPVVRQAANRLVLACLMFLRETAPIEYGRDEYNDGITKYTPFNTPFIERMVSCLTRLLDELPQCRHSVWYDYFSLLAQVAELGMHETCLCFDYDVLQWCMEVLLVPNYTDLQKRHQQVWYEIYHGRQYNTSALVDCIYALLHKHVNLRATPVRDRTVGAARKTESGVLMLTETEWNLLHHSWLATGVNNIVEACSLMTPPKAVPWHEWSACKLVVLLTDADKAAPDLLESVYTALQAHLLYAPTTNNAGLFIAACLLGQRMETCASQGLLQAMAAAISRPQDTDLSDVANSVLQVLITVYETKPAVILAHVTHIASLLLVCDIISVEDNTAQWLREQVLDKDSLVTPETPALFTSLHQRVIVAKTLLKLLGQRLRRGAMNQEDAGGYSAAIGSFGNCYKFLEHTSAVMQTTMETQLALNQSQGPETEPNVLVISGLLDDTQYITEALESGREFQEVIAAWINLDRSRLTLRQSRDVVEEVSDEEAADSVVEEVDEMMSDYEEEEEEEEEED